MTEQDDEPELDDPVEEDDPDTGAEDDPLGFDPETDQCDALDHGIGVGLILSDRREVRRVKRAARNPRRRIPC